MELCHLSPQYHVPVAQDLQKILQRLFNPMRDFVEDKGPWLLPQFAQPLSPLGLPGRKKSLKNKSFRRESTGTQHSGQGRRSWNGDDRNSCVDRSLDQSEAGIGYDRGARIGNQRDPAP